MNTCYFCGGELEEQLTAFVSEENGQFRIIRHVPAKVCKRCGEKEYTPEVTQQILNLLKQPSQPAEILHVLAYDMVS